MKRRLSSGLCIFIVMLIPASLMATDDVAEADELFEQGGLANYKQAIELYQKAITENPGNYEANWKCARAYREYGDAAKSQKVEGWKDICAQYGKEGMQYAQRASELDPAKPDGYYYYGLNVGIYSDGVSIFTEYFIDNMKAHVYLGELLTQMGGDKNKTEARSYLEKAIQTDDPYFRDKAEELLSKLK